jgi:phosphatidylinositol alpha-1,6-mannosyltransferase
LAHLRIALFLNLPMERAGGAYGSRYPHLFDFFLALGSRARSAELLVPLRDVTVPDPEFGEVKLPSGVRVVGLPFWSSAETMLRRAHTVVPAVVRYSRRGFDRCDLVGAVVPSVAGDVLVALARLRRRPVFMLIRGEKQRTVRWMMGARKARGYVLALRLMEAPVRRWIHAGVPTFVAGNELVERYDVRGARLHDLYPALSREFPLLEAPREARGEGPLRLVTVARLSPEKGLDDLLRAVAELRDRGTPVTVELVGEGPHRAGLEGLIASLRIGDRVRLHGFVGHGDRLLSILDAADLCVLPSRSEGLPHAVVEAMARGLPVIATAIGGLPRLLADGRGIVVPVGDPPALAGAIERLAADEEAWRSLSRASLEVAHAMHPDVQLAQFVERLLEAYPELPQRARRS